MIDITDDRYHSPKLQNPRSAWLQFFPNALAACFQPGENFVGISVRGKDRIENFYYFTAFDNPSHPFDETKALIFKGGKLEGSDKLEVSVAEDFKGEVNALDQFLLIFRVLRAGAEYQETEFLKFPVKIAEAAGVRRAATGSGNQIPFLRDGLVGLGIPWIEKNYRRGRKFGQVDEFATGALKRNGRQSTPRKMIARAIVCGYWQRGRQAGRFQ